MQAELILVSLDSKKSEMYNSSRQGEQMLRMVLLNQVKDEPTATAE